MQMDIRSAKQAQETSFDVGGHRVQLWSSMDIMAFPYKLPAALKSDCKSGKHFGEGTIRTFLQWNKGAGRSKSFKSSRNLQKNEDSLLWGGGAKGKYRKCAL